jgi:hypothetical protein
VTKAEAEMCAKIGNAMADAWIAARKAPDVEARVYFDTPGDLIVGADAFMHFVTDLVALGERCPVDLVKTALNVKLLGKRTIELKNGSCVRFLLKGETP